MRCLKPITLLSALAVVLFATVLSATQSAPKPATPQPADAPQAQATPPAGYAGSEACATCHTGYDASINASKHGFASNPKAPMGKLGCESCHGPGEAHMN